MKIIGHRGAAGLAPENTIASFRAAIANNVDSIECDVHQTKDGVPILYHDSYIEKLVGDVHKKIGIKHHTLAQLRKIKPNLATLEEALNTVDGKCEILVEFKENVPYKIACDMLAKYNQRYPKDKQAKALSFEYDILLGVLRNYPEIEIVLNERWSSVRVIARARKLRTKRIQMNNTWLWSGVLRSLHRRGFKVAPYTVNDPRRIDKWKPYLYGVVTDRPDLFSGEI